MNEQTDKRTDAGIEFGAI